MRQGGVGISKLYAFIEENNGKIIMELLIKNPDILFKKFNNTPSSKSVLPLFIFTKCINDKYCYNLIRLIELNLIITKT